MMEYKYSNTLLVVFVTMMYGSSMPFMYVIAMIYFFTTYWTEKTLFFYYYRKPDFLDENLAKRTNTWLKFALFLHMLMGVMMFMNEDILPIEEEKTENGSKFGRRINNVVNDYSYGTVDSTLVSIYLAIFSTGVAAYLIWRFFYK